MSSPTQLVQKLWNYCNMGSLAPTRSGWRPSVLQNLFRSLPSGSSLCHDSLSCGARPAVSGGLATAKVLD